MEEWSCCASPSAIRSIITRGWCSEDHFTHLLVVPQRKINPVAHAVRSRENDYDHATVLDADDGQRTPHALNCWPNLGNRRLYVLHGELTFLFFLRFFVLYIDHVGDGRERLTEGLLHALLHRDARRRARRARPLKGEAHNPRLGVNGHNLYVATVGHKKGPYLVEDPIYVLGRECQCLHGFQVISALLRGCEWTDHGGVCAVRLPIMIVIVLIVLIRDEVLRSSG
mmetsp:Transcript_5816/g.15856  ORF Transcript_5816/g.15856 Transcript_5816/m.15856 type:complete len:226 (+) Transcript_5816:289-966(+)